MFSMTEICTPTRVDEYGKLKLFSAFQMMYDCLDVATEAEPQAKEFLEKERRGQFLASRQVEIVRVPDKNERLTIQTSVFDCKELYGFRNDIIRDAAGEPCYLSWSMGAFIDIDTGRLKKLPKELIESITYDEKYPMEYKERRIRLPKGDSMECASVVVTRNDIDYNHHMNNSHYIRIATEILPDFFSPKSVRVEYKTPALMGQKLTPTLMVDDNTFYVILSNEKSVCAIMEFK